MDVDIDALKREYQKKTKAAIVDSDEMRVIIPVLLREIDRLEKELNRADTYVKRLESKRPVLMKQGKHGNAKWLVKYDEKLNRIYMRLEGIFNSASAKSASNGVITILSNAQKDFDVISDFCELRAVRDLRVMFHLKKVQYSFKQAGIRTNVRIMDEKNKVIFNLFNKMVNDLIQSKSFVASNLDEANKILDNPENFLKV